MAFLLAGLSTGILQTVPVYALAGAVNDTYTVDEDSANPLGVTDNDTGNRLEVTSVSDPANGTAIIHSNKKDVVYTPDTDYVGSDSFTYTLKDKEDGTTSTATVSITIEEGDVIEQTCDSVTTPGSNGWTTKFDDPAGYPDTVTYNAPDGYMVDKYCVKAGSTQQGNGPIIVDVTPPSTSVTIDYPDKDSISHYVVHLIQIPATGTLSVDTDCEEITFGTDTFNPEGATVTFTLNGEAKDADTYKVSAGEYTVVMFVNGTEVDRQTVQIDECVAPPAGTLAVRVNCESITFRATAIEPSRATVTFELNGTEVEDGQHVVPAGEYTIDLYVNGTKVDTETRTVTECEPDKKTELCHATHSETNPYELIDVSVSAAFHGHLGDGNGDHQDGEDIIPPFEYRGNTYSQNWDEEGQAIYENDCVLPDEEPPVLLADIDFSIVCVENGVKVTLTNSGDKSGTATVNGTVHSVDADSSKEVVLDYDLGTPFKTAVTVTVDGITSTQTVSCITGGRGGAVLGDTTTTTTSGQVLGTSTQALPETLPSTGGADSPLAIIIASIIAYGAAYFLQGRRLLGRKEALSA